MLLLNVAEHYVNVTKRQCYTTVYILRRFTLGDIDVTKMRRNRLLRYETLPLSDAMLGDVYVV